MGQQQENEERGLFFLDAYVIKFDDNAQDSVRVAKLALERVNDEGIGCLPFDVCQFRIEFDERRGQTGASGTPIRMWTPLRHYKIAAGTPFDEFPEGAVKKAIQLAETLQPGAETPWEVKVDGKTFIATASMIGKYQWPYSISAEGACYYEVFLRAA